MYNCTLLHLGTICKIENNMRQNRLFKCKYFIRDTRALCGQMSSGVYIKSEIHIFAPHPSWFIFFPKWNFQPFFCNFVYFKSIGEKIWMLFTNWGKNMHFPPLFLSPFNNFFPPTCYLVIFWGLGGQTEKYTPLDELPFHLKLKTKYTSAQRNIFV